MYNLWLIFSIATIAGMGIYVGWHFAKAIATGLSIGIDWLAIKLQGILSDTLPAHRLCIEGLHSRTGRHIRPCVLPLRTFA